MLKAEGIIIKRINRGEFDRFLTVYTKEFGKINLKARSSRKEGSKLKGHLELFNHVHLMIIPSRGASIVGGAENLNSFAGFRRRIDCLAAAHCFSELIDKTVAGSEKDEGLWALIVASFDSLAEEKSDPVSLLDNFEKKLGFLLGYGEDPLIQRESLGYFTGGENYSKRFLQKAVSLLKLS